MEIPRTLACTLISLAALVLCACTDVVSLAHGDPGRDTHSVARTPNASVTSSPPAAAAPVSAVASLAPTPAVTPEPSAAPALMAPGAVSEVAVTFSDHAQQLASADPRLTPAAVALAVEGELRAHQLYTPAADSVHRTLTITVQDFTSTLASNVTVLGYTFRNLLLVGEIQVQDGPGDGRSLAPVHARARVTDRDASAGAGSLQRVYTRFAQLTVADLRGVEAPAEPLPR